MSLAENQPATYSSLFFSEPIRHLQKVVSFAKSGTYIQKKTLRIKREIYGIKFKQNIFLRQIQKLNGECCGNFKANNGK